MFDPKCEELARHFLAEHPEVTKDEIDDLADEIQDVIEEWMHGKGLE